ncbi:HD-GYP domain-containing protein [Parathalassolituus penaei]|uniref:Response regulator n=1 Tax=Parathalassolituus penaei TaxID=2997323 RepID=A0A9X3EJC5_9GAMM|nr:HD domain-containing phosphohydrolase [Parathalassolituus penaei]MCY0965341.1 response regulator [Parathalassolituus penaei]
MNNKLAEVHVEQNFRVLVVDDVADNIQVAMNILREDNYDLSYAMTGQNALNLLKSTYYDLILLDVMMPDISGFNVCEQIRKNSINRDTPIIFLTARADIDSISKGFQLGAVDYIVKPFHAAELLARTRTHLELHASRLLLKQKNMSLQTRAELAEKRLLSELEQTQMEMIHILTELMEFTSDETGKHIKRVAEHSRLLAHLHESLTDEDETVIFHAAPMHDIGKVFIPEHILHKPGRLTDEEMEIMRSHTTKAHQFLKNAQRRIMRAADIIALQHHEKWDGSGYPAGLKGHDIHIYGRIVALADVFDALTHKRVYKEAWGIDNAVKFIVDNSGTHFDPYLVELFRNNLEQFIHIAAE